MTIHTSPTVSRTSSLSSLSKTTALDALHTASELHHIHHPQSKDSDATQVNVIKVTGNKVDTESFDLVNDSDPEKGFQDQRRSLQLPEESSDELGRTCSWVDLPQWMRDNPAIITGYRRATNSYRKCLRSLWYLHNESVNIWSHLLGAIAFVIIAPVAYYKILVVLDAVQWTDITVLFAFLVGAIICLTMSASFHTFCCHSEKASSQWVRCDYLGIIFLIVGSCYPAIFYGFYCHTKWQIVYISLITTLGAATIIGVMRPKFQVPQFRWVRSVLFLALGLSGLCPIIHSIVLYGFELAQRSMALNYMFCMGATYVFGTLIYGSRVPERFYPGKFDNFMASHQIFHICVLIGATVHLLGVVKAMAFWHDSAHSCSIPLEQLSGMFTS
ncbi:hemolysin-III related-domain-containing protein [Mortierella sp. GBAus27b]|nr:hypothetical protein BGX31_006569 [Mortierella sp. GBA43]KAI8362385.1 hemolysin-III related-domain-containing protein [Mortierella sp. GBAus27b]